MPVTGEFQKLRALQAGFTRLSRDGIGATRAAMAATKDVSEFLSEQERDPTGKSWAPLKASTLRKRRPGPKLQRIYRTRRWQLLSRGRWRVTNSRKPHDLYHALGTQKMAARPDLPVMQGGMLAYGGAVHEALGGWIRDAFAGVGLRLS